MRRAPPERRRLDRRRAAFGQRQRPACLAVRARGVGSRPRDGPLRAHVPGPAHVARPAQPRPPADGVRPPRAARRADDRGRDPVPDTPAARPRDPARDAVGARVGRRRRHGRDALAAHDPEYDELMGVEELRYERRPAVTRPVLICSFRGWNDGGQGASLAASFLARSWHAERFADIDPELFFDFQMTRPHVSIVDDERQIDWPENSFHHAHLPQSGDGPRDMLLLLGTEPSLRWRAFTNLLIGVATEFGASMVVTLGSLLADVPHARPSPVTASASDARVLEELGLQPSRYEG